MFVLLVVPIGYSSVLQSYQNDSRGGEHVAHLKSQIYANGAEVGRFYNAEAIKITYE